MTHDEIALQDCVERLVYALTGKPPSRQDLTPLLAGNEYHLPDSGSRLIVNADTGKAALTDNSRAEVKEQFQRTTGLVAELERLVDLVRRGKAYFSVDSPPEP